MTTQATSTFVINTWEPTPYDEQDGVTLTRTHLTKTFQGEIEGTSTADLLMASGQQEGSAAYVGLERITARVHERSGSFILLHSATAARGAQSATWSVVPDSGTGELKGLRGEARIINEPDGGHTFILDYDLV